MTKLPQIAPFHAPALVRLITAELSEDDLSYGVEVDAVYAALIASRAAVDPCRAVLAMLVCGDFQTMPRLRVLAVRPRLGGPLGDTHLRNVDGVMLYGDDFAMPGDAVLVRLQTCAVDARSALRFALLDCPGVTKSAAFERVRQLCPRTSMRALERDWSCARLDVGLSARGRAGRPKKTAAAGYAIRT